LINQIIFFLILTSKIILTIIHALHLLIGLCGNAFVLSVTPDDLLINGSELIQQPLSSTAGLDELHCVQKKIVHLQKLQTKLK